MTDYGSLGFKCGLEIHQQLEGRKLFCNCPTLNTDADPDIKFERRLHAVAGETGEVDVAAAHEMRKGKKFVYVGHSSDVDLVELDEEPPHDIDKDSLHKAMQVALLLNAKPVDEIQVMRKTVVDGSNVSGFQRTSLVAVDGHFETSQGTVTVPTICLEEEAAQKLEEKDDYVTYRLDRLGIPLIEIATDASIKDAEHAKEAAAYIGMVLRSVDGVKRGLGTIRQDVNVSIKGGARIEVKGFQDLKSIPKVIGFEVERQQKLISNNKKVDKEVRKAEPDFTTSFLRPMPGAARLYPETDVAPIIISPGYWEDIKASLPTLLTEKIQSVTKKYNLSEDLAKEIASNTSFESYVNKFSNIKPNLIAQIIIETPKEIKSRLKLDPSKLSDKDFEEVLSYLNDGKIPKDAVLDVFVKKIKGEKINVDEFKGVDDATLEKEIQNIIKEKPGLNQGAYMGLIMAKFKGKVEGKRVMVVLNRLLK